MTMWFPRILPILLMASVVTACNACGSAPDAVYVVPEPEPGDPEPVVKTISVATYNTGLGPGMVAHYAERKPLVADALGALTDDVLCMQEAWTADAEQRIVQSLDAAGVHSYVYDTAGTGTTGEDRCSASSLQPITECVERECGTLLPEEVSSCALDKCSNQIAYLYLMDRHCLTCIVTTAGLSPSEVVAACTSERGVSRIQGGRNGIILASPHMLVRREAMVLDASAANRVALFATLEMDGREVAEVACTHLSASQQIPPMHTDHSSWEEERMAQFIAIDVRLKARAAESGLPVLFVGDVNFRRPSDDEQSDMWDRVSRAGWVIPAADVLPPICTVCPENTFKSDDSSPGLIDHVLFQRADLDSGRMVFRSAARVIDTPATTADRHGTLFVTDLSDHYGLAVTLDVQVR